MQVGFSTSLGLLQRNGVTGDSFEKFMEILRGSAIYSPQFDKKLSNMQSNSYGTANFPTKVWQSRIRQSVGTD